jgi:hypothetical protein
MFSIFSPKILSPLPQLLLLFLSLPPPAMDVDDPSDDLSASLDGPLPFWGDWPNKGGGNKDIGGAGICGSLGLEI